jgi:hypothetical protein
MVPHSLCTLKKSAEKVSEKARWVNTSLSDLILERPGMNEFTMANKKRQSISDPAFFIYYNPLFNF